jgi:hypothetical protein
MYILNLDDEDIKANIQFEEIIALNLKKINNYGFLNDYNTIKQLQQSYINADAIYKIKKKLV